MTMVMNNNPPPATYPFDPTGIAASNLITGEQHIVNELNYNNFYLVIPDAAVFFGTSLVITYSDANTPLKTLIEGADYSLALPYWTATKTIGAPIYGGILIFSNYALGTINLQYQAVGDQWSSNVPYILSMISQQSTDIRMVIWDTITNNSTAFPGINFSSFLDDSYGTDKLPTVFTDIGSALVANPVRNVFLYNDYFISGSGITAPVVINTPTIISPTIGTIDIPQGLTLGSSPFSLSSGIDSQASASWELATDSGFTNIVQSSINSTANLNSWAVSGLLNSTAYYSRVQYTSVSGTISQWSAPVYFTVIASSKTIATPTIISPINGTIGEAISFTMSSSPFSMSVGIDTQASASWEISSDSSFSHIVLSNMVNTTNLNNWTASGLANSTTYYARVMYSGTNGEVSQWSTPVSFTTVAASIVVSTPSIISPVNGTVGELLTVILSSTRFALTSGIDSQASASWELATDNAFTNIVQSSINSTVNITSWTVSGLINSATYYARVQHTSNTGVVSQWSGVIYFTTVPAVIVIAAPTINTSGGTTNIPTSFTVGSTAFTLTSGLDTQASASWEIATDNSFTNIVQSSINSTVNLNSWSISNLLNSTGYYIRAQYTGVSGTISPWSTVVYFSTIAAPIVIATPYITSPINGTINEPLGFTIYSSPFTLTSGLSNQASASWELATDSGFSNIVQASINDTVHLTSMYVSGLSYSTGYYIRVMYIDLTGKTSAWSNPTYISTVPNPVLGIGVFGGGNLNGTAISATSIYTYVSNTAVAGGNLDYSTAMAGAAGNGTIGVFGRYTYTATATFVLVYTYSSNTAIAGGNLNYAASYLCATGNSTVGVFGGGININSSSNLSGTSVYSYATNTSAAGGNLSYALSGLAAAGNSTVGVFGGGKTSGTPLYTTSVYTYSSNSAVAGGNLSYAAYALAAAGNSSIGVFGGGYNISSISMTATSIYTYSSNTAVAGGNLSYLSSSLAAAGNAIFGVFGGGFNNNIFLSTTSIYTYSSNTAVAGGNLTYVANWLTACGPNSGVNA